MRYERKQANGINNMQIQAEKLVEPEVYGNIELMLWATACCTKNNSCAEYETRLLCHCIVQSIPSGWL